MSLAFTKMHGLGNDYVYVSVFDQLVSRPARLARAVSDRHRGVGGDGLILVAPPEDPAAHVRMIVYNADGSRAQMCGNGIRCVGKFAYERGLARVNPLRVQTDAGVLELQLRLDRRDRVRGVRVDLGPPILEPRRIPVKLAGDLAVNVELPPLRPRRVGKTPPPRGAGETRPPPGPPAGRRFTAVSMGNPHAVFHVPDVARVPLAEWGPVIASHPLFPEGVNVHFAQVLTAGRVRVVTWERGAGATQACGTGAAAVCVAGALSGRSGRRLVVELPGGELRLEWNERSGHVFMTGPAQEVFTGQWPS